MTADRDDYDSPWKDAVERYLPEFMAFFFPVAHASIDWSKGYAFLDTELQAVVQDAELGRRFVDALARVTLNGGGEAWILAHIEVQGKQETSFAERMLVYNYRLFDRYRLFRRAPFRRRIYGWRLRGHKAEETCDLQS